MSKWAQKFGTKELSNLEVVQQCRYKDIESYMVDQMVRGKMSIRTNFFMVI